MPFSDQPRRPCRVLLPWRNIPTSTRQSRRLPTVRLGEKRRPRSLLARAFRRVRLRWLRLQYSCMMRKLKAFYSALIRDLLEASATMEVVQSRIMMETYFAAPVLPVSLASLRPAHGSSPYRA